MPETISQWVGLALSLITLAGLFYNWLTSGGSKALKDLGEHKKEVAEKIEKIETAIEERCDKIEAEQRLRGESVSARFNLMELQFAKFDEALKHLPDRSQSHDLAMAIEKMAGQIGAMDARLSGRMDTLDERLKPVASISDRLQEFLIDQAGTKK